MPGATPLSEVLSDPVTRSEWLGHERAGARLKCRTCAACVHVYLQEAGTCVLRLACVCECVSVCVRGGGWPGSLSFLVSKGTSIPHRPLVLTTEFWGTASCVVIARGGPRNPVSYKHLQQRPTLRTHRLRQPLSQGLHSVHCLIYIN